MTGAQGVAGIVAGVLLGWFVLSRPYVGLRLDPSGTWVLEVAPRYDASRYSCATGRDGLIRIRSK